MAPPDPVESWRAFCAALADAGELVLEPPVPGDADVRADGIRALSRYATLALERCVEHIDVDRPEFFDLQTPIRKYMGDNPDQTYRTAQIAGDRTYVIRGSMDGAVAFELAVYAGGFGAGGRRLVVAVEDTDLEIATDGTFEIVLSAEEHGGDWLRLEPDASSVLIRTYFTDLERRRAHAMPSIERVPAAGPAPMITADQLDQGLRAAALFTSASFGWWLQLRRDQSVSERVNTIPPMRDEGDLLTPDNVRHLSGDWALGPDEALVVDIDADESADYWSVVPMGIFGETVDWRTQLARHRRAPPGVGRAALVPLPRAAPEHTNGGRRGRPCDAVSGDAGLGVPRHPLACARRARGRRLTIGARCWRGPSQRVSGVEQDADGMGCGRRRVVDTCVGRTGPGLARAADRRAPRVDGGGRGRRRDVLGRRQG